MLPSKSKKRGGKISESPTLHNLPSGVRQRQQPLSLQKQEEREVALQKRLASYFANGATVITLPFSLDELEKGVVDMDELHRECHRLESQAPQVMSAIFKDKEGIPILAYGAHRILNYNNQPPRQLLTIETQYLGRTQVDLDLAISSGSKFTFDGMSSQKIENLYIHSQYLFSEISVDNHQDSLRHSTSTMTYVKNIQANDGDERLNLKSITERMLPKIIPKEQQILADDPESEEEMDGHQEAYSEYVDSREVEDLLLKMEDEEEGVHSLGKSSTNQDADELTKEEKEKSGVCHLVHGWIQQSQANKGLFVSSDISNTGTSLVNAISYFKETRSVSIQADAYLEAVFPKWHAVYRDAYKAGCIFPEDYGPYLGRAVVYKLQGLLHKDRRDGGPTMSVSAGLFNGGEMCIPQLKAKFKYGPGEFLIFFSSILYHKVLKFEPYNQTPEMQRANIPPGRVGTVFFFPFESLSALKGKPPGWATSTAFGRKPFRHYPSDDEPSQENEREVDVEMYGT